MSQDYNATINLPQTEFPMRAGLPKREPEMLAHWNEAEIYKKLICDMIAEMTDERFLRQIYSIIYRQKKRVGI